MFLIGICLGSFIANVYFRERINEDWIHGNSKCDGCRHTLSLISLIPLLSYIIQHGKCKYCSCKISPYYFWIELITGLLAVIIKDPILFLIICVLVVISIVDWYKMLIYDISLILLFCLLVLYYPLSLSYLNGFVILFFLIIAFFSDKFGMGDVKVLFVFSLFLPFYAFISVIKISIYLASIYAILLMLFKKAHKKTYIPFAPFIALSYVCYLVGYIK